MLFSALVELTGEIPTLSSMVLFLTASKNKAALIACPLNVVWPNFSSLPLKNLTFFIGWEVLMAKYNFWSVAHPVEKR